MGRTAREAEPKFSQPVRQVTLMLLVLGLTGFRSARSAPAPAPAKTA